MDQIENSPRELSNPFELKDVLSKAICAYMEQYRLWARQNMLHEDYDETLEECDFAAWLLRGHDLDGAATLSAEILESLEQSEDLLYKGSLHAREILVLVLKCAITSPPDIQTMVLGNVYDIPGEEMDAVFAGLFEELIECGHDSGEQGDVPFFLGFMKETIENGGGSTE